MINIQSFIFQTGGKIAVIPICANHKTVFIRLGIDGHPDIVWRVELTEFVDAGIENILPSHPGMAI